MSSALLTFLSNVYYGQVSNISTDQMLYTESDLEAAMDKIETINFHEEKEVSVEVVCIYQ